MSSGDGRLEAMRYRTPSIIEALCEVHFRPGTPWDLTVFGRFDERMSRTLPRREQAEAVSLALKARADGFEQKLEQQPRMRFLSSDGGRVAQVGPNLLIANVLAPYPHWPPFRAFILDSLRAYVEAAQPLGIVRLTLRYIDHIRPPAERFTLGDWLGESAQFFPTAVRAIRQEAQSQTVWQEEDRAEGVTLALQRTEAGEPLIVVDTMVAWKEPGLAEAEIGAILDRLHARIIEIFEECISERTRELLEPERG